MTKGMADYGAWLRKYRVREGLALRDVAETLGMTPTYLGEIERGRRLPSSQELEAIDGLFPRREAMTPDDLARAIVETPPSQPQASPTRRRQMKLTADYMFRYLEEMIEHGAPQFSRADDGRVGVWLAGTDRILGIGDDAREATENVIAQDMLGIGDLP